MTGLNQGEKLEYNNWRIGSSLFSNKQIRKQKSIFVRFGGFQSIFCFVNLITLNETYWNQSKLSVRIAFDWNLYYICQIDRKIIPLHNVVESNLINHFTVHLTPLENFYQYHQYWSLVIVHNFVYSRCSLEKLSC